MPSPKYNPFKTPPVIYDYGLMVEALALCRERVPLLTWECGDRLPMRREAEALMHDIGALAQMLPEGAADQIIPNPVPHSTSFSGSR